MTSAAAVGTGHPNLAAMVDRGELSPDAARQRVLAMPRPRQPPVPGVGDPERSWRAAATPSDQAFLDREGLRRAILHGEPVSARRAVFAILAVLLALTVMMLLAAG